MNKRLLAIIGIPFTAISFAVIVAVFWCNATETQKSERIDVQYEIDNKKMDSVLRIWNVSEVCYDSETNPDLLIYRMDGSDQSDEIINDMFTEGWHLITNPVFQELPNKTFIFTSYSKEQLIIPDTTKLHCKSSRSDVNQKLNM